MRFLKFLALTLVVALGFSSCKPDNGDDHNHTSDLAGTWTCLTADFAEAMVINEDSSVVSTILVNGNYMENMAGNIGVENGNVTLTFEDGTKVEGHFDVIPGVAFSIETEDGGRMTFNYCEEDLSEEIVGMWVCNDGLTDGITIMSYSTNGKSTITTANALGSTNPLVNRESDYVVVGDLVFMTLPTEDAVESQPKYTAARMIYTPNGTSAGDIMTHKKYIPSSDGMKESVMSFLRIKQNLELPGQKYDYMKTFVTNVKGEDKDIPFLNTSFNFAKMDGSIIDKFLKSILFTVEFPEANKIKYSYLLEGQNIVIEAPIEVVGNKMTIKMSANNPAYQDVDMYAFQDQDNTQMHWYMYTTSFEKFFANTSVALMLGYGQLDKDDTEGIANIYKTIADAVESINLSLVMTKAN